MDPPRPFARLLGASILASAGAGLLLLPLLALTGSALHLASGGSFVPLLEAAPGVMGTILILGWFAAFPAMLYGTLPAFVIGGTLQAASRKHAWAATRPAWACAGAAGGALVQAFLALQWGRPPFLPLELIGPAVVLAGAGGGLVFRSLAEVGWCEQ
jgi:hypothetical protein